MLPFGVTIPATVPQRSETPEGLKNYRVILGDIYTGKTKIPMMEKSISFENAVNC
jgi:hypothetical protein